MILYDDLLIYIYDYMSIKDLKFCSRHHWECYLDHQIQQKPKLKKYYDCMVDFRNLKKRQDMTMREYMNKKKNIVATPVYFKNYKDVEKYNIARFEYESELYDYVPILNHLNSQITKLESKIRQYRLSTIR